MTTPRKDCRITRIDTYVVGARWCNWVFAHVFTDDGIEATFQVNHLGGYVLTELLKRRLV